MSLPKIVFAGTPDFSVSCLKALLELKLELVGVYTQPDRVAGRGKKIQQSPVKQCALKAGVTVYQPHSFKQKEARETLRALQPDLMIVVAYGLILPQSVLDIPTLGCINIHASLLPRWRGAAPIQRAIEAGDTHSGVCLMQMEKGLDTGPILACSDYPLRPDETGGSLHDTLSVMGAKLLAENLNAILNGKGSSEPQPEQGVTYAHKLNKDETQVDWQMDAKNIANKVRAFNPWPVMASQIDGKVIRFHHAFSSSDKSAKSKLGEIVSASAEGITIQTNEGLLCVTKLQKPGGKVLLAKDFLNGFKLSPGQRFE